MCLFKTFVYICLLKLNGVTKFLGFLCLVMT